MRWCCAAAALLVALCLLAPPASAQRRELVDPGAARPRAAAGVPDSLRQWIESLPPEQRRVAVRRLRSMPPAGRERFFRRWESATPAEREQFTKRMEERAARMLERRDQALEQRRQQQRRDRSPDVLGDPRFQGNREAWESMRPGQRERMRKRLERFGTLSAAEQEAMVERHFADRSAEERAQILKRLRSAAGRLPPR